MIKNSYRSKFAKPSDAKKYDAIEYSQKSYSTLIWEIEKSQIESIVKKHYKFVDKTTGLDFACGTGRVLKYMSSIGVSMTGIEISDAMVSLAKEKDPSAKVLCKDITREDAESIEGVYDVITAFRFLLNAEPEMRQRALDSLKLRMKDDSILIINNHGNLFSHKLLLWPVHSLRRKLAGIAREGNYLSNSRVHSILKTSGLKVFDQYSAGFLSDKITRFISNERAVKWEKAISRNSLLKRFCVNQMYVVKLA